MHIYRNESRKLRCFPFLKSNFKRFAHATFALLRITIGFSVNVNEFKTSDFLFRRIRSALNAVVKDYDFVPAGRFIPVFSVKMGVDFERYDNVAIRCESYSLIGPAIIFHIEESLERNFDSLVADKPYERSFESTVFKVQRPFVIYEITACHIESLTASVNFNVEKVARVYHKMRSRSHALIRRCGFVFCKFVNAVAICVAKSRCRSVFVKKSPAPHIFVAL